MTWTLTKRTWFYKDPDFPAAIDSKSNWFNWFLTTFLATKGWTTEVVPDGNDTWYGLKKTVTDASGKEVNLAYSIEIEPNSSDITYGLWVDPSSPPSSGNQVIHYSESTNLILNSNTKGMEVWESDEDPETFMLACLNYGTAPNITARYVIHVEWPSRMIFMGTKAYSGNLHTYMPYWFYVQGSVSFYDPILNSTVSVSSQYPVGPCGNYEDGIGGNPVYGDVFLLKSTSNPNASTATFVYASLPDIKIRNPTASQGAYYLGPAEVVLTEGKYYIHTNYLSIQYTNGSGFLFDTAAVDPTPPEEPLT